MMTATLELAPPVGRGGPSACRRPEGALQHALTQVAEEIVANGTYRSTAALEALSAAMLPTNPGVAAALVDWNGSEIARQRAFGIAHTLAVEVLDGPVLLMLLDRFTAVPR